MKLASLSLFAAAILLGVSPAWAQDADGDGVLDSNDNCINVANASQLDSNFDGYGNLCDADLWNDGIVDNVDYEIFLKAFGGSDPHADFNGDGVVGAPDFVVLSGQFGGPPGPSGLACAGSFPCADATVVGDADGDGTADNIDNCVNQANSSQTDTDGDGFGNRCDPDFDNDGATDNADYEVFVKCFGGTDPACDFNGDGVVGAPDFAILSAFFGLPSGPAGAGAQNSAACTPAEGNCP